MEKYKMVSTVTAVVLSIFYVLEYCPLISAFPTELESDEISTGKDKNWDFLLFAQQWPPTACAEWKEVDSSHKCLSPESDSSWTVHGIWPTTSDGHKAGIAFCNNSWHFDVKQLQDIMPQLLRYWPNLYVGTSLWSHEWSKHGTCAASLPSIGDQLEYFSAGINWAQEYNMYSVLNASNIIPSAGARYKIKDIEEAIVKGLGVIPILSCDLTKSDKSLYLQEVRLCIDKELKLQNCPTKNSTAGYQQAEKCPSNAEVDYAPMENSQPSSHIDLLKILAVVNSLIGITL